MRQEQTPSAPTFLDQFPDANAVQGPLLPVAVFEHLFDDLLHILFFLFLLVVFAFFLKELALSAIILCYITASIFAKKV